MYEHEYEVLITFIQLYGLILRLPFYRNDDESQEESRPPAKRPMTIPLHRRWDQYQLSGSIARRPPILTRTCTWYIIENYYIMI